MPLDKVIFEQIENNINNEHTSIVTMAKFGKAYKFFSIYGLGQIRNGIYKINNKFDKNRNDFYKNNNPDLHVSMSIYSTSAHNLL